MRLAAPVPRSMRLNGKATCLRLEQIYWSILDYEATRRDQTVTEMLAELDRAVQLRFGRVSNFSSLTRAVSVAHLAMLNPGLWPWLEEDGT